MLVQPYGLVPGRHVALLGEWDPSSAVHEQLFGAEVAAAAVSGRPTLVVTFDPSPVSLLMGAATRPPFDDVASRLAVQERTGVQSRVTVGLTRTEVDHAGVAELLDALADHVEIGELVLGVRQTLGTQELGNDTAIRAAAVSRGIEVRRLAAQDRRTQTAAARSALTHGKLACAVELIGHPLYWSRPENGSREMHWPPGNYQALPLREPTRTGEWGGDAFLVPFIEDAGGVTFPWPDDDIPWLGFVCGPADPMVDGSSTMRAAG